MAAALSAFVNGLNRTCVAVLKAVTVGKVTTSSGAPQAAPVVRKRQDMINAMINNVFFFIFQTLSS
jgi:hypothetical protein